MNRTLQTDCPSPQDKDCPNSPMPVLRHPPPRLLDTYCRPVLYTEISEPRYGPKKKSCMEEKLWGSYYYLLLTAGLMEVTRLPVEEEEEDTSNMTSSKSFTVIEKLCNAS